MNRAGVTLAELLVVIAILAVLASLVISITGTVMNSAGNAACLSNLRQVGAAVGLFAAENGDVLPAESNKGIRDPDRSPAWFYRLPPYVDRPDVRGRNTVFQCPSFRWSNPEHFDHASPKSLKWNALLDSSGRPDRYAWGQAPDEHEIVLFIDAIAGETGMGQWGHAYPSAVDGSRHRGRVHILFLDGHGIGYEAEPDDGDWEAALRWTSRAWQ